MFSNVNNNLKRHLNTIDQTKRLKRLISSAPRVTYSGSRNLRNRLVTSRTKQRPSSFCRPCANSRCKVGQQMKWKCEAKDTNTDFKVLVGETLNCYSSNNAHLILCDLCGLQYVGQTETSFNNQRGHEGSLLYFPISRHVRLAGHAVNKLFLTLPKSGFASRYEWEQE